MSFHTMQGILDRWAIDESFDPVAYKAERRFTGSVAVITKGVIKFLEWLYCTYNETLDVMLKGFVL